eukprot:TRINITY_DN24416_c0_g1_i4.p1 TRINITY_DN24416_c0_g1~~TRINITY_DN24416_c0_g1_i4.p1  ORF type:complete len:516 (+),score=101.40 TRINITY_DN24416_c0_g1_i4:99-1550(+)
MSTASAASSGGDPEGSELSASSDESGVVEQVKEVFAGLTGSFRGPKAQLVEYERRQAYGEMHAMRERICAALGERCPQLQPPPPQEMRDSLRELRSELERLQLLRERRELQVRRICCILAAAWDSAGGVPDGAAPEDVAAEIRATAARPLPPPRSPADALRRRRVLPAGQQHVTAHHRSLAALQALLDASRCDAPAAPCATPDPAAERLSALAAEVRNLLGKLLLPRSHPMQAAAEGGALSAAVLHWAAPRDGGEGGADAQPQGAGGAAGAAERAVGALQAAAAAHGAAADALRRAARAREEERAAEAQAGRDPGRLQGDSRALMREAAEREARAERRRELARAALAAVDAFASAHRLPWVCPADAAAAVLAAPAAPQGADLAQAEALAAALRLWAELPAAAASEEGTGSPDGGTSAPPAASEPRRPQPPGWASQAKGGVGEGSARGPRGKPKPKPKPKAVAAGSVTHPKRAEAIRGSRSPRR